MTFVPRSVTMLGIALIFTAAAYTPADADDCLMSPSLSANLNDYARCWVKNVGKRDIPLTAWIIDGGGSCTAPTLPADPEQDGFPTECTRQITSGNNSVQCLVCSPDLKAKTLRQNLVLSLCIIPLGSNRCDGAVSIAPTK